MRKLALCLVGCVSAWPLGAALGAEIAAGASIQNGEVESFHLAVREHYHATEADVVAVRKAKVKDEELPVVFFIAQRAKCSPSAVVELRAGGKSWLDVSAHFGLGVEVFHVEVEGDCGPPYGRALGHFKHRERHQWGTLRLSDEDVGLLVSLSFLSERHGCSPSDVIRMHVEGESLVSLHGKVRIQAGKGKPGVQHSATSGGARDASGVRAPKGASSSKPAGAEPDRASGKSGAGTPSRGKGGSRGKKK